MTLDARAGAPCYHTWPMLSDTVIIEAVHEGGHAVACHRLAIPIISVSIGDRPHLRRALYRMSPRSVGAWRLAVMCLSGGEAERSICGSNGGDQIDAAMAQNYLTEEKIDVLLERARQAARRLVIVMRPEIELVARALLARGKLSGAQVNMLLDQRADVSGHNRLQLD